MSTANTTQAQEAKMETKAQRVARIKATMASYNDGSMLRKVLAQGDAAEKMAPCGHFENSCGCRK